MKCKYFCNYILKRSTDKYSVIRLDNTMKMIMLLKQTKKY